MLVHFTSLIPILSMLTLAISCSTTSNLPWFMDLTFQFPMLYCSLQYSTLLPSPVTSTTGHCFCFGWASSFLLELFPCFSQGAYWASTDLGSSFFSVLSFCLFILFTEFSKQEYWSGLPFPSPGNHVLSELSNMTHPSWVTLCSMAHSFIELGCGPCYQFDLFSVIVVSILSVLWWIRRRGLLKLPDGRDWLWGNLGLALKGRAMISKLIQFSTDG